MHVAQVYGPSRSVGRFAGDRGAATLPELVVVAVASVFVLFGILIALDSSTTVAARTEARSSDLTDVNEILGVITRDVRSAYMIAPADPALPAADVDGVSLLVQANDGSVRDPRVWVTYRCGAPGVAPRACTRTVNAAESPTPPAAGELPAMTQDINGRFTRGTQIGPSVTVARNLFTGATANNVFSLGLAEDAAPNASCATADCVTWFPPKSPPSGVLDARSVFRRSSTDARPPVLRVQVQIRTGRSRVPVAASTALSPRGCVDPALPTESPSIVQMDC